MASPRMLAQAKSIAASLGNRKFAVLGDSREDQDRFADPTNRNWTAEGFPSWLRFLTRQRVDHRFEDNFGVPGDTTAQMLARTDAMLAATDAAIIIIFGGTNDRGTANMLPSQSIANMGAIRDKCLAAGRTLIFIAEAPRGDAVNTSVRLASPQLDYHMVFRQWLLEQAVVPGCYVADPWPLLALSSSATGDAATNMMRDGLHPAKLGALNIALSIAPIINALLPPLAILPASNADLYSVNHPKGSLVTNPMMAAGDASLINVPAGGSAGGVLATGWTNQVGNAPGMTLTYSKVTRASDGKTMQRVVVGGTPTGAATADLIRQTPLAANLAIGDVVEGFCDLDIAAGQSGCLGVSLRLYDQNSGVNCADLSPNNAYPTDFMPNVALSGVLRTPRFTLTSTNIRFMLANKGVSGTAISQTIDAALVLRKVVP